MENIVKFLHPSGATHLLAASARVDDSHGSVVNFGIN